MRQILLDYLYSSAMVQKIALGEMSVQSALLHSEKETAQPSSSRTITWTKIGLRLQTPAVNFDDHICLSRKNGPPEQRSHSHTLTCSLSADVPNTTNARHTHIHLTHTTCAIGARATETLT